MDVLDSTAKRLLFIINPVSGKKLVLRSITDIISIFQDAGYTTTVMVTQRAGDARVFTQKFGKDHDRIVVAGGDGSLNEVVTGLVLSGQKVPVGYIPCGSTNDFARSVGLSTNVLKAAKHAASGVATEIDIGHFGSEYFTYVAAFGMFTDMPYTTAQSFKNVIGHAAYIIDGLSKIGKYNSVPMRITADGERFTGDFLFGAICNSTSVAGVLTLPDQLVDLEDGKFELLLIHAPDDTLELSTIVNGLLRQDYSDQNIIFRQCSSIVIENPDLVEFSLDGERSHVYDTVQVSMLPHFLMLVH